MAVDPTHTTVASLDTTAFGAAKNDNAEVGIIKIVSEQPDLSDESDHDITYWSKGDGKGPLATRGVGGRAPGKRSAVSASTSKNVPAHSRSAASNVVGATNPTKSSHTSKDKDKAKNGN